jgi:hypothetical protein
MSGEELRTFYEKGLQQYIKEEKPEAASDWPPSYRLEIFRATTHSGHKSYRTVILPSWTMPEFGNKVREHLRSNGVDWVQGMFFIHTIRGVKHGNQHGMDQRAAEAALELMLLQNDIRPEATDTGSWWIDVGLEMISSPDEEEGGRCLQWMTASHSKVVERALGIDAANATRITKLGSSKYSRDLSSHLPAVSGCRIEPGTRAEGYFEAAYLQLYTTDKSVTYHNQGAHKHAKEITIGQAMGKQQPAEFVIGLYDAYITASEQTASNARMEMRVPLDVGKEVFFNADPYEYKRSLLSFSKEEWW